MNNQALFTLAIHEGNAKKPIYEMHKWWARRLGAVFRYLLLRQGYGDAAMEYFYDSVDLGGQVVLDPFMGGGTSIVEALKCGCRAIGCDLDPVAWFIVRNEVAKVPIDRLQDAFNQLDATVGRDIGAMYETLDEAGQRVPVTYCFWVQTLDCGKCGRPLDLHPHFVLSLDRETGRRIVFCPDCSTVFEAESGDDKARCPNRTCRAVFDPSSHVARGGKYSCRYCKHQGHVLNHVGPGHPLARRLFAVEFRNSKKQRVYKASTAHDQTLFEHARGALLNTDRKHLFPSDAIPEASRTDARPVSHGFKYYHQLFNERQLYCLSMLFEQIVDLDDREVADALMLAFSDSLAANNMLCPYAFGYQKLTPLFGLHAYNVIQRPVENNIWGTQFGRGSFPKCFRKMVEGKRYALQPYEMKYDRSKASRVYQEGATVATEVVGSFRAFEASASRCLLLNRDSRDLPQIEAGSVDLVLTDPPYFDNIAYSKLSDFYYQWLKLYREQRHEEGNGWANSIHPDSLVVPANGNDADHTKYTDGMAAVFSECRRALRRGGRMVLTFHHSNPIAWACLSKALRSAGFVVVDVLPVRSEGKSGFHSTKGNIKWDAVLTCKRLSGTRRPLRRESMLKGVGSSLRHWRNELSDDKYGFAEIDQRSLAMALAAAHLTQSVGVLDFTAEIAAAAGLVVPQDATADAER